MADAGAYDYRDEESILTRATAAPKVGQHSLWDELNSVEQHLTKNSTAEHSTQH